MSTPERTAALAAMTPDELRAEIARLDTRLAEPAPSTDAGGLLPLVLHVGGAAHRGTQRRLVRCATAGPFADRWMVQIGDVLVCTDGSQLQARPFHAIRPALQERAAWPTIERALDAARSVRVG